MIFLLGTTQLSLVFGKNSAFCGADCVVKNAVECEVGHVANELEYATQYKGVGVGQSPSFL